MRIKKKYVKYGFLVIVLIIASYFTYGYFTKDPYQVKGDTLSYSKYRGKPEFSLVLKQKNESYDVYSVIFKSRNFLTYETKIYGLLFMPHKENAPGLVLLPGGGVSKESEADVAAKIANWGYAVLTFDQRGIGQTGGIYLGMEQDYQVFSEGKEPVNHLSVYDALRAYDVLKEVENVDKDNIAIAGESMGGRYSLIAAAIEKRFKGFIGISTGGFHFIKQGKPFDNYLISIDPDHYVDKISPRKVFMLHGNNDTMVSLDDAKKTFDIAKEPKKFFVADGCGHGYCNNMEDELREDLKKIFGR
jgi:hypothetical protein